VETILPLALRDVSYSAEGKLLLDGLTFELRAGERTVLLGPNGAGKSLTLRLCHGLLAPGGGSLRWLGPGAAEARARQAMVFQRPVLLRRTALANVTYALSLKGVPRARRQALALKALEQTGLGALAGRQARVLSAGEQQRLTLARAWALRPEVLFLDEPTASLDPAASRSVEEIIAAIHAAGSKIVMTTHDLGQARRLADEVLFLHRGRLLEQAPADRFFNAPRSEAARAFLAGELLW
jgi:tungstate transport system ATP-binding protein